jgi:F-type H+-transporting ATPase subunit delta
LLANAELALLWNHPVVSTADKQATVRKLFGADAHPLALNLMLLLFDKKRGPLFPLVQKAYKARVNARKRLATVHITSASPMEDDLLEGLRHQLAAQLDKEIHLETSVEPALIGGLVLQMGDRVIDNSLRGRLAALRETMS